jgi:polyphosphate glucokinase
MALDERFGRSPIGRVCCQLYNAFVNVLVIDIGGSHVKVLVSGKKKPRRIKTGEDFNPRDLMRQLPALTRGWKYDVISLGYPGRVGRDGPEAEPGNLGRGWMKFDFKKALKRPLRIVNDATMQALGGYRGGRMLFLGLGTGIGSSIVSERVIMPLELGELPWPESGETLFERIGKAGRKRYGQKQWCQTVVDVVDVLRRVTHADYVVLGGGNAKNVHPLPPKTRRGGNDDAFVGGFRLWEETVEPHDQAPSDAWRVVR